MVRRELIARFGVGFVTVFAVADWVEVITRKPEMATLHVRFESGDNQDGFAETNIKLRAVEGHRLGTSVVVWLKDPMTVEEVRAALTHYIRGWDALHTSIHTRVCSRSEMGRLDQDETYVNFERDFDSDKPVMMFNSDKLNGLVVLQDGILVELNAADLLPAEVVGFVGGYVNLPPGILELVGARDKFRRTPGRSRTCGERCGPNSSSCSRASSSGRGSGRLLSISRSNRGCGPSCSARVGILK